ncbi:hypothetical protein ACFL21_00660 [Patescibacteria group bacterium]
MKLRNHIEDRNLIEQGILDYEVQDFGSEEGAIDEEELNNQRESLRQTGFEYVNALSAAGDHPDLSLAEISEIIRESLFLRIEFLERSEMVLELAIKIMEDWFRNRVPSGEFVGAYCIDYAGNYLHLISGMGKAEIMDILAREEYVPFFNNQIVYITNFWGQEEYFLGDISLVNLDSDTVLGITVTTEVVSKVMRRYYELVEKYDDFVTDNSFSDIDEILLSKSKLVSYLEDGIFALESEEVEFPSYFRVGEDSHSNLQNAESLLYSYDLISLSEGDEEPTPIEVANSTQFDGGGERILSFRMPSNTLVITRYTYNGRIKDIYFNITIEGIRRMVERILSTCRCDNRLKECLATENRFLEIRDFITYIRRRMQEHEIAILESYNEAAA